MLWDDVVHIKIPEYLISSIERIVAVTSSSHAINEAFTRTIIDQILISAVYDENTGKQGSSLETAEEPAILELHHETPYSDK